MFAKGKSAETGMPYNSESSSINLIATGTEIVGQITATGDIRIDGTLRGNLTTKGKLVIGQTGLILGDIECRNSDVSGKAEGKIIVTELLSLKETANVTGEINVGKLHIEPGAVFNGTCTMGATTVNTFAQQNLNARKTRQEQNT